MIPLSMPCHLHLLLCLFPFSRCLFENYRLYTGMTTVNDRKSFPSYLQNLRNMCLLSWPIRVWLGRVIWFWKLFSSMGSARIENGHMEGNPCMGQVQTREIWAEEPGSWSWTNAIWIGDIRTGNPGAGNDSSLGRAWWWQGGLWTVEKNLLVLLWDKPIQVQADIETHSKLVELMEREYWYTQILPSPRANTPDWDMSVRLRHEIFRMMQEEIPKLIAKLNYRISHLRPSSRLPSTRSYCYRLVRLPVLAKCWGVPY